MDSYRALRSSTDTQVPHGMGIQAKQYLRCSRRAERQTWKPEAGDGG
ncbi:MAG: hypothetical protein ACOY3P_12085 [Planctomycetota bacterium]